MCNTIEFETQKAYCIKHSNKKIQMNLNLCSNSSIILFLTSIATKYQNTTLRLTYHEVWLGLILRSQVGN